MLDSVTQNPFLSIRLDHSSFVYGARVEVTTTHDKWVQFKKTDDYQKLIAALPAHVPGTLDNPKGVRWNAHRLADERGQDYGVNFMQVGVFHTLADAAEWFLGAVRAIQGSAAKLIVRPNPGVTFTKAQTEAVTHLRI